MHAGATSARGLVRDTTRRLEAAGVPEPVASAEVLLSELLGIRRGELAQYEEPLTAEQERAARERADARAAQIGTGDRSEKIRTYNFPQSRITDHRIGFTTHALGDVLDGDLAPLLDALVSEEQRRRLAALSDGS